MTTSAGPSPTSSAITVSGSLTDTVSGAQIGTFSQTVSQLPATLTLSAPGHLPRRTTVSTRGQAVDLIPDTGFDLDFFRQFARGSLDNPDLLPLLVWRQDVSIYVQVEGASGFATQVATQLEPVARRIVPDLTGNRLDVVRWETGTAPRDLQPGWIIVERSPPAWAGYIQSLKWKTSSGPAKRSTGGRPRRRHATHGSHPASTSSTNCTTFQVPHMSTRL